MVQGYYTLHEAAEATGLSEDELKQRAQRKEIRSFQDRGTLRFRIQDVQELQRQLMGGSDPDLQIPPEAPAAEAPRSSGRLGAGGPKSGPKTPTGPQIRQGTRRRLPRKSSTSSSTRASTSAGNRSTCKARLPAASRGSAQVAPRAASRGTQDAENGSPAAATAT